MIKNYIKKKAKKAMIELAMELLELVKHSDVEVKKDSILVKFKKEF